MASITMLNTIYGNVHCAGGRVRHVCRTPQQLLRCWPAQQPRMQQRRQQQLISCATPGLGDEDLDVAVFRFTLGIPGFDDSNIPRVVGAVVAALVVVNHLLGAQPAPPAQVCEHPPTVAASCRMLLLSLLTHINSDDLASAVLQQQHHNGHMLSGCRFALSF
eukprot:GHUV01051623.1.p1 GENE.GHUV01051623.1~~GHUV01051623.1.p1  ORF type:complete len:162 (+),score=42.71 GHUV01051623.1:133-618(+)